MVLGPANAFVIIGAMLSHGLETAVSGRKSFGKSLLPAANLLKTIDEFIIAARYLFTAEFDEMLEELINLSTDLLPPVRYGKKAVKNYSE